MTLTLIAALSRNHAIGRQGQLPWHLPEDLQHFKALTLHHTVIMGRRTFQSLPHGPLPMRTNVVLSRSMTHIDGCEVRHDLASALQAHAMEEEVFIIGGESVYREALPLAQTLELTLVDTDITDADAFFPPIDASQWALTKKEKHNGFSFVTLKKVDLNAAPNPSEKEDI